MLDRVMETIRRHGMVAPGETVILAVSGGADSMALLHLFVRLREAWGLRLHAAHLDHRLRAGSAEDAAFVREQAARWSVPVTVEAAEVRELARAGRRSLEEAGRAARYDFFARLAQRLGASRVATAHSRDDQVETVLMALLAGGPWEMLAGIPPVRPLGPQASVVRPLRELRRGDLEAYLREQGIPWRDDPTNRDLRIRRNQIRLEVLSELRARHPLMPELLWTLGEAARDADAALARLAAARGGHLMERADGTVRLSRDRFRSLPPALRRRVLQTALTEVAGTVPPLPRVVVGEALRAAEGPRVGREVRAGPAVVRIGYDVIEVDRAGAVPDAATATYALAVPGTAHAAAFDLRVSAELAAPPPAAPAPDEALFDADCVQPPLVIRSWRAGDRLALGGTGGKKKVQDLFVDAKVPRWRRGLVPLVVDARGTVLWVVGYRRSGACAVTERTTRVLRVRAGRA